MAAAAPDILTSSSLDGQCEAGKSSEGDLAVEIRGQGVGRDVDVSLLTDVLPVICSIVIRILSSRPSTQSQTGDSWLTHVTAPLNSRENSVNRFGGWPEAYY